MYMTNLLETKTVTFREIIGNGKKYAVPLYQRDYSWKEEQWEDLWLDIDSLKDKTDIHYMGSIVLKSEENKTFTIIDGQQRFITLSIIILAALKNIQNFIDKKINPENNIQRKEILMNTFLGSKDAVSLTYASKLKLNAHNNDFYQSRLLQLSIPPSSASLNDSCKLMLSAFKYYDEQIAKSGYLKSAEDISKFIEETIGEKILFIQISVADEISAYTMFETLNARRLELTATDLLKNYLFSLVKSDIDINNLNSQWETIVNTVGVNQLPKFLRYYLNSYQPLIRTDRLFKEIKKQIIEQNQVFPLLNKMQDFADIYTAIDDYENDIWKKNKDMRDLIREINLYNAEQHKSLVMAAYFNLSESEFIKVLRILKALIFRYTVIAGLNPNDLEKIYNKTAIKISNKKIQDAAHIFTELKPVYLETEYFINSFSTKTFKLNSRTKKLVRYILLSIENQRYCTSYSVLDRDASIEHILPENPNEEWENFFKGDTIQSYIARLGNLSLLEEKLNTKDAADKIFEEKKQSYKKSKFQMTQNLCTYPHWDSSTIKERQLKMAKTAAAIWKVEY